MPAIEEIEKTVLALPVAERAFLAQALLSSLPAGGNDLSEEMEMAEAARRDRQIEGGEVQPLNEAEFWRRVGASARR